MSDPMPAKATRFVAELKGIKLPAEVEKRISTEIQQVVMRNLATVDLKGDYAAKFPGILRPPWLGIWIEPVVLGEGVPTER